MESIILREYYKWVKALGNGYLNKELYRNGYDPFFPPLQVMGNICSESSLNNWYQQYLISMKKLSEEVNGDLTKIIKLDFDPTRIPVVDKLDMKNQSEKILIIGLEPRISDADNPFGTYQLQYDFVYNRSSIDPHFEFAIAPLEGGQKIERFRENLHLGNYLKWNLNYFETFPKLIGNLPEQDPNLPKYKGHWNYISQICSGLYNIPFNQNEVTNWSLIGKSIIEMDIIPMHGPNKPLFNKEIIDLFIEKLNVLNPKNILILGGKNIQKLILNSLFEGEEYLIETIYDSSKNNKISKTQINGRNIYMRNSFKSRGPGNSYFDAYRLGELLQKDSNYI